MTWTATLPISKPPRAPERAASARRAAPGGARPRGLAGAEVGARGRRCPPPRRGRHRPRGRRRRRRSDPRARSVSSGQARPARCIADARRRVGGRRCRCRCGEGSRARSCRIGHNGTVEGEPGSLGGRGSRDDGRRPRHQLCDRDGADDPGVAGRRGGRADHQDHPRCPGRAADPDRRSARQAVVDPGHRAVPPGDGIARRLARAPRQHAGAAARLAGAGRPRQRRCARPARCQRGRRDPRDGRVRDLGRDAAHPDQTAGHRATPPRARRPRAPRLLDGRRGRRTRGGRDRRRRPGAGRAVDVTSPRAAGCSASTG